MKFSKLFAAALVVTVALPVYSGMLRGVVPVAGSTSGAFGANFRTSLQLSNRTDRVQAGALVFHPAGVSASPSDPSLPYVLEPHQTVSFDDVVATMGVSGLGSMDLVVDSGGVPAIVARAYDDQQEAGTTGTGIELVATADALAKDDSATLIVPRDLERFRFNIGVRTLGEGATILVKIFDVNGNEQAQVGPMSLGPDYFVQQAAADFLGTVVRANDAIAISVVEGNAIVYGTVTDNTTNDPSIHIATRE